MWHFSNPLHKAQFKKRYKRFFVDAELETGEFVTAHCPNTGSMATCMWDGCTIWLSKSDDPKRKLQWTWELTETDQGFIGVNTSVPNKVVESAVLRGDIPELSGYQQLNREVKYGVNSRIDLLLSSGSQADCYVEIKNTTLLHNDQMCFPDAKTERGQKHIKELVDVVRSGRRGVLLFFVNRPEGQLFAPATHIDPVYASLLKQAVSAGVEVLPYRAEHSLAGIRLTEKLPWIL